MSTPRRTYQRDEPQPHIHHHWPYVDEDLLPTLPVVLRAVVKALGFGRAQQWLQDHGGVNVCIPQFREQAMDLEPDELARMRDVLAPHMDSVGRVTLPKADKLFIKVRNTQIRKDRGRSTIDALARGYSLTSRQIKNICREGDDRQYDLF